MIDPLTGKLDSDGKAALAKSSQNRLDPKPSLPDRKLSLVCDDHTQYGANMIQSRKQ